MSKSECPEREHKQVWQKLTAAIRESFVFLIQAYRVLISPHFGRCCRFYPSCSAYAQQAVRERGVLKGLFLTIKRLMKCQPFHPGGIDVLETRA